MKNVILILGEQNSLKDEVFQMLTPNNNSLQLLTQFDNLSYFIYQYQTWVICFPGLIDLKNEMLQIVYKFNLIFKQLHIGLVIDKQNEIEINEEIEKIRKIIIDDQQDPEQNFQKYASFFYIDEEEKIQNSQANVLKISTKEQQKSKQNLKNWLEQTAKQIQSIKLDFQMQEQYNKQANQELQKLSKKVLKITENRDDLLFKFLVNTEVEQEDFGEHQYQYQSEIFTDLFILTQNFQQKQLSSYYLFQKNFHQIQLQLI